MMTWNEKLRRPPSCLKGVQNAHMVYVLTNESYREIGDIHVALLDLRFSKADMQNSPAVFGRVGQGFVGFVGDVNCEQGATHVLLEMCGVRWTPGELGERKVEVGVLPIEGTDSVQWENFLEMKVPAHVRGRGAREAEVAARRIESLANARVKQAAVGART